MQRRAKFLERTDVMYGTCSFCMSEGMAVYMDVQRKFPDNQFITYTQIIIRMFVIRLDKNPMKLICRECEEKLNIAHSFYRMVMARQKAKTHDRMLISTLCRDTLQKRYENEESSASDKDCLEDKNERYKPKRSKFREYRSQKQLDKKKRLIANVEKSSSVESNEGKVDNPVKFEIYCSEDEQDNEKIRVENGGELIASLVECKEVQDNSVQFEMYPEDKNAIKRIRIKNEGELIASHGEHKEVDKLTREVEKESVSLSVDNLIKMEIQHSDDEQNKKRKQEEIQDKTISSRLESKGTEELIPKTQKQSENLFLNNLVKVEMQDSDDEQNMIRNRVENLGREQFHISFSDNVVKIEISDSDEEGIQNQSGKNIDSIAEVIEKPPIQDSQETVKNNTEAEMEKIYKTETTETVFIKSEIKHNIQAVSTSKQDTFERKKDMNETVTSNEISPNKITRDLYLPMEIIVYSDNELSSEEFEVPLHEMVSFEIPGKITDCTEPKLRIRKDLRDPSSESINNNKTTTILTHENKSSDFNGSRTFSKSNDVLLSRSDSDLVPQSPILQEVLKFKKTYGNKSKAASTKDSESRAQESPITNQKTNKIDNENTESILESQKVTEREISDRDKPPLERPPEPENVNTMAKSVSYVCNVCSKHFDSLHNLRTHSTLGSCKPKTGSIKCSFCPRVIRGSYVDISLHMQSAHGLKTVLKKKDKQNTPTPKDTPIIIKEICQVCSRKFDTQRGLMQHVQKSHPFKCKICRRTFSLNIDLQMHKTTRHGATFQCVECNEVFVKRKDKINHERQRHGSKQIECKHCDYVSYSKSFMDRHLRIMHEGKKEFKTF